MPARRQSVSAWMADQSTELHVGDAPEDSSEAKEACSLPVLVIVIVVVGGTRANALRFICRNPRAAPSRGWKSVVSKSNNMRS